MLEKDFTNLLYQIKRATKWHNDHGEFAKVRELKDVRGKLKAKLQKFRTKTNEKTDFFRY